MITEDQIKSIALKIRNGNYANVVCLSEGISEQTYYNYMKRGKLLYEERLKQKRRLNQGEKLYLLFFESVQRADAKCEVDAVTSLKSMTYDNSTATVQFLERRYKKRWGKETSLVGDPLRPIGLVAMPEKDPLESLPDSVIAAALTILDNPDISDAEKDALAEVIGAASGGQKSHENIDR